MWIMQALCLLLLLVTLEISVVQCFHFGTGRVLENAAKRTPFPPIFLSPTGGYEDGDLKLRIDPMFRVKLPPGMDPYLSKKEQEKIVPRLEAQAAAANGTVELKSDLELLREAMKLMLERMS
jgi:hypothetical protein